MVKNVPANAGKAGLNPGLGRSPEEGHGNPLQYSYLENPIDRGAWLAIVHRIAESDTTLKLNHSNTYVCVCVCVCVCM